uniref:Proteasome maturation factor UMP1 n=1 Tax=Pseudo-nitzschia australis TaxID=44445 RepID=A0A6U9XID0_9STRA|mmetsp:Transcript_10014/g.21562  ORF Transcript_10014/g.21562 Transcript_10014/m.21562 type:complete len:141 (+) Transcript_10014:129-551(+)|eukprot:CAMPEP_0168175080 /NCGR_PEP_ID=MMETSP0139_2-20121125/6904_1 /TAXON_ID=44445 /ORGANISM="Pseudo-nitzschia australis, Strain 10249 10 AB" /LENGTH=140 /DNA_ID=CAMNT_0008093389 /DNA_START=106 /DNA_END=528 /DNA_ORIENTATION=+
MSTANGIPVMNKPVDSMEVGPNGNNLATAAMRRHPIEELQRRQAAQRISFMGTDEEEEVRRLYGSGFAMKLATERRIGNQTTIGSIGGGIPSSNNVMGDILSGRDMQIGFEDTLGVHEFRPTINKMHEDPHMVMERKLGM